MHVKRESRLLMLAVGMAFLPHVALAQAGGATGVARVGAQPVPGVVVEVSRGDAVVTRGNTDRDGRYRIALVPGVYGIAFRASGLTESLVRDVAVADSMVTVDVALQRAPLQLNPVQVSASRKSEPALEAPASVSVVNDRAIQERTSVAPLDHVVGLPGVDVAIQGLQSRQVVARGFNQTFGTSLLMMTDYRNSAIPSLRGNLSQYITAVDDDLERVEALRGPASALYGPNAADGVIHFITKSPFASPGTSASIVAGGRSFWETTLRHASVVNDRLAFKVSGKYVSGEEWSAPPEPAELTARDPDVRRASGEARIDFRPSPTATAVFTVGSALAIRHVEYTSIGASQIKNWRYDFAQLRYNDGPLFAQLYVNRNDAGESFDLRTLDGVTDLSNVVVAQVQHGFQPLTNTNLRYGLDLQRTDPRTEGTISGRNEDDDTSLEVGGYLQSETRLTSSLLLSASARLDRHSRMDGTVFSPRLGLVYTPRPGHRLRASYNRAFTTPTSTDLFVDIVAAKLGPLPYSIRAVGVPQEGFRFATDCAGYCMYSPFAPGQRLPLDATVLWPAVVRIMQANGIDLSALPAPTSASVKTVLRALDPSAGAFRTSAAPPRDIDPLSPTITNSLELGYKGLVAQRVLFDGAVYFARRENFRSPLAVATPNAFLSTADLAAHFARFMPQAQAAALAAAIGGVDGDPALTGIPLATVGPDHDLAGSDILLTYRNFGRVDLWGIDLSGTFIPSERISLTAAYSFTSDNLFPADEPGDADLSTNAPRHKAMVAATYRDPGDRLTAELRGRYVGAFRMLDGVWIGDVPSFTVADAEVGLSVPGTNGRTRFVLTLQNIADERHSEFVGAPVLGRLFLTRLQHRF
jgi:outer membrane receptor for ferrienterochelin and colicins